MMPVLNFHMVLAILGIALTGGILGLDRTAAGQFMLSQPIVAGPLTGWLLGDPTAGIVIGATLELIWVLDLPIGTFVPANATVETVSATAIAALGSPGGASLPVIGFSIVLTMALVPITMKADGLVRQWNSRLADAAFAESDGPGGSVLARIQYAGIALFFLKSFALYILFLPIGIAAIALFGQLPDVFQRALSLFVRLLPIVGVALVVSKLSVKALDQYFLFGFACAAVAGQLFHAPAFAVLLLTTAAGWLGARLSDGKS
jgi:mannose/fructose/N-acetylgalactosamine-specific phosphotransferase system component IIC